MRYLVLFAMLGAALAADLGPREIVRRSVAVAGEDDDSAIADSYTFLERVLKRQLDGDGGVKSQSSKTHQIMMIEGSPYRRLVKQDGKLLPPEEQREQQESLRQAIEARRKETKAERAKRLAEYEERRKKYRKALGEIPNAFNFRMVGEEMIHSRPAYVIEATPRPGYKHQDRYSKLFTELQGTLWINKADYRWVRLEAELLDSVWFGWILVRIGKGARVKFERIRVNDEVWLPSRLWYTVALRIGLVKGINIEDEAIYTDYRKLQPGELMLSAAAP